MFEALWSVLPVFVLMGIGYGAGRVMQAPLVDALKTFVFYFAIPAFLFRMAAGAPFPSSFPLDLWGAYYGGVFVVWLLSALSLLWFARPLPDKGVIIFGCGFSNSVLLGIPIIVTTLGEEAAVPLLLLFSIHTVIQFSACTVFMEAAQRKGKIWGSNLVYNPVLLALLLGFLQAYLHIPIPEFLQKTLQLLSEAALPTALFCAGALLTLCKKNIAPYVSSLASVFKLGIHPCAVYILGAFVFGLPPLQLATATVMAALPSGIYTLLLAHRYQTPLADASGIVIVSTVVSLLTLPLILTFLGR